MIFCFHCKRFRDPAGRCRLSAVAWLPDQATQVIVAYDDDTHPSLQVRMITRSFTYFGYFYFVDVGFKKYILSF
jgi:hypothetical protein